MTSRFRFVLGLVAGVSITLTLSACGDHMPGDATGAKVLRNLLEKNGVDAKLVSFKKVQGREVKRENVDAYELMYEAEILFPEGFEAKCADERERGTCAFLGLDNDRTFTKAEVHTSEGTLHFVKSEKGWMAEDSNAY
ncbi:hypothetical protein IYY11_20935 [Methylocystis sp. H62]|jgi:hypothetical protein|uniref:hypothetical protein n=1 Tax=Methylocystis sp. H62 TaxID=2785789 RepID=UPI000D59A34F|nr:hypothetical protein [Methylocystis sp. H62]MBG0795829.1 hypothetical protein [Methylocystis sp. H62]PWB91657.1 hypothetical protein C5688_03850 [Methylocystis sp. MitZ-2018]